MTTAVTTLKTAETKEDALQFRGKIFPKYFPSDTVSLSGSKNSREIQQLRSLGVETITIDLKQMCEGRPNYISRICIAFAMGWFPR
jgi:hypothetical protein